MTRSTLARPVCSFNVLFFFFKILTFTRGFDTWGPLVRMIMKVLLGSSVPPPRFFFLVLRGVWSFFSLSTRTS